MQIEVLGLFDGLRFTYLGTNLFMISTGIADMYSSATVRRETSQS